MADTDNGMDPLNFRSNMADTWIWIKLKISIRLLDYFWLRFL